MRTLRWCLAVFLLLVGAGMLLPAVYIAFWTDWLPKKELRPDEAKRVATARDYVELQRARIGRMPRPAEFQEWAKSAPSELRLDGVGFAYLPIDQSSYVFEWWGGNASMRWRSNGSAEVGEIRESDYFLFGSKLFDLTVFFGLAAAAIYSARIAMPRQRVGNAS